MREKSSAQRGSYDQFDAKSSARKLTFSIENAWRHVVLFGIVSRAGSIGDEGYLVISIL